MAMNLQSTYTKFQTIHIQVCNKLFEVLPDIIHMSHPYKEEANVLNNISMQEYCPVIVGGAAYRYYMHQEGRAGEALFTEDIDIKIAIQKSIDQLNSTDILLRTIIRTFRYNLIFNIIQWVLMYLRQDYNVQFTVSLGGKYADLNSLYNSINDPIEPIELSSIILNYTIDGVDIHTAILDTSYYLESEILPQFNMYRDIFENIDTRSATTIIGFKDHCNYPNIVDCLKIANPIWLLLDIVRMISKIEIIGDSTIVQPLHSDYYKINKYIIKFLQLLSTDIFRTTLNIENFTDIDILLLQNILTMNGTDINNMAETVKMLHMSIVNDSNTSIYKIVYSKFYTRLLQQINSKLQIEAKPEGGGKSKKIKKSHKRKLNILRTRHVPHVNGNNHNIADPLITRRISDHMDVDYSVIHNENTGIKNIIMHSELLQMQNAISILLGTKIKTGGAKKSARHVK